MEKVDFCFFVTETFIDAECKILLAKELERRGFSSFFITSSDAGDMIFRKSNLSNFQNLERLSDEIKIEDKDLENEIPKIEKTFGISNIKTEILTDKIIFKEDENKLFKKFITYLLGLKKFFDGNMNAKYFIQGMSPSINSRAFYYNARLKGKDIYFSPAPFSGLFNFSFHPWGILEIDDKKINQVLDAEARQFASGLIEKLKKEKKWNLILPLKKANPYITKERFKTFFRLLKSGKAQHLPTFFIIKNFWKRYFRQFLARKFYSLPQSGEKYIFFPLHFPDDSQLTLRAMPFITQEFIIEIVSRYLPFGYKIYIKEHPASVGYFSLRMLSYISKLPNVRIVPPLLNPYDLIEKAEIVCVINSTVGFEALMYQKPVITFGESFYRGKGVTLDVVNLYDLPYVINKAKNFKPNWEKILKLLYLWYKNSFPPSPREAFYTSAPPTGGNIKIFCDSLLNYLKINSKNHQSQNSD